MKMSEMVRANNRIMKSTMPETVTKIRSTIEQLSLPEIPGDMAALVNELNQKLSVFMAMGMLQSYFDLMEAYADVMELIEHDIGEA